MLGRFRRFFSQSSHQSRPVRPNRLSSFRVGSLECLEPRTLLSGAEISVFDNVTPISDGTSSVVELGTVGRGDPGPTRVFTVRNDGDSTLSISELSLPPGFSVVEPLSTTLVARTADNFTVRLDTTAAGSHSGDITISSNDADESVFNFPIHGTVTPNGPEIVVRLGAAAIEDGGEAVVAWPGAIVGDPGEVKTFTVENVGNQTLSLISITIPSGFAMVGSLPASVAAQSSATFSMRLFSATSGRKSGTVHLLSNDPDVSSFDFAVTGLVTASEVPSLTLLDGLTVVNNGDTSVDFGKAIQGQTGPTRSFTVRNDGTDTLEISSVALPTGFVLLDTVGATIAQGESDSFTVQLDTTSIATMSGDITIASNDPAQTSFHFGVSGNVVANAPEIQVFHAIDEITSGQATPFVFDSVVQGKAGSTAIFTVANVGAKVLTIGTVTVPAGFKVVAGLPQSLPPDTFSAIVVQLESKVVGTSTGNIIVSTNDTDENPFLIPISGTVRPAAPEIAISVKGKKLVDRSAAPLAFGDGYLGQTGPTQSFTVRNEGAGQLTLGTISLPVGYMLVQGLPASLASHKSASFVVRLDTSALGDYSGEISVVSNDSDENPFRFSVRASVLVPPAPDIAVLNGDILLVSGDTTAIDLGTAPFHKKGTSLVLSIRNDGDGTLNIAAVDVPAGFVLAKKPPKRIAPNRTITFQLRLDSRTAGFQSGAIVLHSDDASDPAFSIAVQGTVLA